MPTPYRVAPGRPPAPHPRPPPPVHAPSATASLPRSVSASARSRNPSIRSPPVVCAVSKNCCASEASSDASYAAPAGGHGRLDHRHAQARPAWPCVSAHPAARGPQCNPPSLHRPARADHAPAALSRTLPPGSAPPARPEQYHAAIPAWPRARRSTGNRTTFVMPGSSSMRMASLLVDLRNTYTHLAASAT